MLVAALLAGAWRLFAPALDRPSRRRSAATMAVAPIVAPALVESPIVSAAAPAPAPPTLVSVARARRAEEVRDFPYRDDDWLPAGHKNAGRVWIPAGVDAGTRYPIAVLLHGLNPDRIAHAMLSKEGHDLARVARDLIEAGRIRPVLLAAPSQIRGAETSVTLWQDFSLDHFLWRVRQALPAGVGIDARRVVVLGHSGAGCNRDGGLWRLAETHGTRLRMLAAVDTCLDPDFGRHLRASVRREVTLVNLWQPHWERPVHQFERELGVSRVARSAAGTPLDNVHTDGRKWWSVELADLGKDPHTSIVERAAALVLQLAFPARPLRLAPPASAETTERTRPAAAEPGRQPIARRRPDA